jgi:hypothetical protein
MTLAAALRSSISDIYFNSWRLAPANLAWSLVLVMALLAGPWTIVGLMLAVILAVPTAGVYRMAALIARGEPAMLFDFLDGMRRYWPAALATGTAAAALAIVFVTNIGVGLGAAGPLGWFISAMALWGIVGLAMFLVAFWPVLVDPRREGTPLRYRAGLAGLAVIGRPVRLVVLTALVTLLLVLSTVLFVVLILVGVVYVALLTSRVVLPMVDELEARLPEHRLPG